MRFQRPLMLLLTGAIVACGGSDAGSADGNGDASLTVEELAAETRDAVRPTPGQYASTVEVVDVQIPGLPAEQAAQMKQFMAGMREQEHTFCLTEEQAAKGFEEIARQSQDQECTFQRYNIDGGTFDAQMTCRTPEGDAVMTLAGTGTPESSEMAMDMNMTSANLPGGKMMMKMKVSNRRTGDCTKE